MRAHGFAEPQARLLPPEQGWRQRGWHEPSGWQSEHLLTLHWDGGFALTEQMCSR